MAYSEHHRAEKQRQAQARYRERNREDVKEQDKLAKRRLRQSSPEYRERQAEYIRRYKADPAKRAKIKAQQKAWYEANKDYARREARFRHYGLTHDQFEALMAAQEGRCPLCGRELDLDATTRSEQPEWVSVDHDHTDNHVRGLLHYRCNTALGWYESLDHDRVRAYLSSH